MQREASLPARKIEEAAQWMVELVTRIGRKVDARPARLCLAITRGAGVVARICPVLPTIER